MVLCNVEWTEDRCLSQKTQIFIVARDASSEDVLAHARAQWAEQSGGLLDRIRHKSFLVQLLRQLVSGSANTPEPSFAPLEAIRTAFPETRLAVLQLPEKADVLNDSYGSLRREIEAAGASYHDGGALCGLEGADFLPNDSHPNAAGYEKVRNCVRRVLGL